MVLFLPFALYLGGVKVLTLKILLQISKFLFLVYLGSNSGKWFRYLWGLNANNQHPFENLFLFLPRHSEGIRESLSHYEDLKFIFTTKRPVSDLMVAIIE